MEELTPQDIVGVAVYSPSLGTSYAGCNLGMSHMDTADCWKISLICDDDDEGVMKLIADRVCWKLEFGYYTRIPGLAFISREEAAEALTGTRYALKSDEFWKLKEGISK